MSHPSTDRQTAAHRSDVWLWRLGCALAWGIMYAVAPSTAVVFGVGGLVGWALRDMRAGQGQGPA